MINIIIILKQKRLLIITSIICYGIWCGYFACYMYVCMYINIDVRNGAVPISV